MRIDLSLYATDKYLSLVEKAESGELEEWKYDNMGRLALIILYDQFPRCIFRGEARAFASDHRALEIAQFVVNVYSDGDSELFECYRNGEKWLMLLPLMHCEDQAYVEACVKEF